MERHIQKPAIVKTAGNKKKNIEEFIGRVNTQTSAISIARMKSPAGWEEPPQTPEFDEYSLVLSGELHIKTGNKTVVIKANELFLAEKGETVQYSTPGEKGAEYIAICIPAFSPDTVNREKSHELV
jgi:ethanolamine utilization protein EutQ (cupin superfamily)